MKRFVLLAAAVVAVLTALVATVQRRTTETALKEINPARDSVWYHASDIALLASTGRPQLLEFFHPN
jgi:hypothetical protein